MPASATASPREAILAANQKFMKAFADRDAVGMAALFVGATGIGLAPILVRLSETGPVATAFYRILLAQPILWLLLNRQPKRAEESGTSRRDFLLAARLSGPPLPVVFGRGAGSEGAGRSVLRRRLHSSPGREEVKIGAFFGRALFSQVVEAD